MESRGSTIGRTALVLMAGCLVAGPIPGNAAGNVQGSVAAVAKKCKEHRHRGKKRRCKRQADPIAVPAPAPARISISPLFQDYGLVPPLGTTTRGFTITSTGGSPSGVPVPVISGPDARFFQVGASTCLAALAPGGTCQVDVNFAFTPPVLTVGVKTALLSVTAVPGGTASAAMTADLEP